MCHIHQAVLGEWQHERLTQPRDAVTLRSHTNTNPSDWRTWDWCQACTYIYWDDMLDCFFFAICTFIFPPKKKITTVQIQSKSFLTLSGHLPDHMQVCNEQRLNKWRYGFFYSSGHMKVRSGFPIMPWCSSGFVCACTATPFLCLPKCRCWMRGIIMWPLHRAMGDNSFVIFFFMSSGNTPKEENYSNPVNQCSQLN